MVLEVTKNENGTRTEAIWLNSKGKSVPKDKATQMMIYEFDKDDP